MYGNVCGETEARIFPAALPSFLRPTQPPSAPPSGSCENATPFPRTSPLAAFGSIFGPHPPRSIARLLVKFVSGRCLSESTTAPRDFHFSLSAYSSREIPLALFLSLESAPQQLRRELIRSRTRGRFSEGHCFQYTRPTFYSRGCSAEPRLFLPLDFARRANYEHRGRTGERELLPRDFSRPSRFT